MTNLPDWSHPNPIYLDYETQSACDIKLAGGRAYTEHPSTRVLILAMCMDDEFIVWIPDYIRVNTDSWTNASLWPYQIKPAKKVTLYRGTEFPFTLDESRPIIAHNSMTFDRQIWNRFQKQKLTWLDTLPLARQSGRNGKLDSLGKSLLGIGKDHAKKLLPKLTTAQQSAFFDGWSYPRINAGDLQAFTRYAVGDVELLRRLWKEFDSVKVEADVIAVHDAINNRGIAADAELLEMIERVSLYSVGEAVNEIKRLTKGKLHEDNIRSGKQVAEWLEHFGVQIVGDDGLPCLRKEIVQKFIDSPYVIEDNLTAVTEIPPVCIDVMRLRMKALRITDAKVKKARARIGADGRIKDLFAYHNAHTGRWSSYGVNLHNLPRPKSDISTQVEHLLRRENVFPYVPRIDFTERDVKQVYDSIKAHIPEGSSTVDDVCSMLIRPSFLAKEGHTFAIADYAQVEARGTAWLADERKMLDAFIEGRDLYKEFAAKVFNVLLSEVTKDMRQIAKSAVLGCQYGLGYDKFRIYAANNGCDLAAAGVTAEDVINAYRNEYTKIAGWKPKASDNFRVGGLWKDIDKACKECVSIGVPQTAGKCRFLIEANDMKIVLPSGRELWYPNARIEDIIPPYCYTMGLPLNPKATVVYDGEHGPKSLYGGLLVENITQAMCRDIMATHLMELEYAGLNPVAHVHDEIICEVPLTGSDESLRTMVRIMSSVPAWCDGFPMETEGFVCPRFNKSPFRGGYKFTTKDLRCLTQ
jgi:DNA polymerase bacteriophage-type